MSPSFHGGKLRDESTRSPDTFWYFLHVLDSRLSNYFCHYANLASFWPKIIQIPYYISHITGSTGIYILKELKYKKFHYTQWKKNIVRDFRINLRRIRLKRASIRISITIGCVLALSWNASSICFVGLLKIKKVAGKAKCSAILEIV